VLAEENQASRANLSQTPNTPATARDQGRLPPLRHFIEEHLTMTCAKKALLVVALTTLLGLWGCAQNATPNSASIRLRELEARNARLEDDYKAALAARDQARKNVVTLEEQRNQLQQQVDNLQHVTRDCEEMKKEVARRTAQRDAMQNKLEEFRTNLLNMVQQMDQAVHDNGGPPVTAAPPAPVDGGPKS
jgi:outer membrane murein-binding lipoprotein Lpp